MVREEDRCKVAALMTVGVKRYREKKDRGLNEGDGHQTLERPEK